MKPLNRHKKRLRTFQPEPPDGITGRAALYTQTRFLEAFLVSSRQREEGT